MMLMGGLYVAFFVVMIQVLNVGIGIVVGISAVMLLCQYFFSDKLALKAMGAKVVERDQAPELYDMVEGLAQKAKIPMPKVAIADTSVPNAFATGRSPKHATVCATTGIAETLSYDELEGVMAHEMAHVVHRDVAIMTIASFLAMVAGILMRWGFIFGGNREGGAPFLVIFVVSLLVYFLSYILMQALSRYREFGADRGGANLTGKPRMLANALIKISGKMDQVPENDLREAQPLNAFFICPAKPRKHIAQLFSTHPPVEKRVERLMAMEAELHGNIVT